MSRKHSGNESPKKIKQELEALQENKEMAEEARAELLQQNHVLRLHEAESAIPHAFAKSPPQDYIKRPEDEQRIARNTINNTEDRAQDFDMWSSPVQQLFAFQFQVMTACMDSWTQILNSIVSPRPALDKNAG